MAGRVQRLDGDALSDLEDFAVCRGLADRLAVLAANDGELAEGFQLFQLVSSDLFVECVAHNFIVTTGVVPVTGTVSIFIDQRGRASTY